ncbi:hypothetical protein [Luteibaculum oceani]|uniref:Uncharacterized protein n=1 Tax=Luteibaculum oceani TaxID=1294296 RepID=A0A5C6V5A5_9FLAO|nr:hypothetical protein [Luteibaculum oceani]TXC78775.1 hypothetical protein FRX97_06040 [Luteibaculum oceani]
MRKYFNNYIIEEIPRSDCIKETLDLFKKVLGIKQNGTSNYLECVLGRKVNSPFPLYLKPENSTALPNQTGVLIYDVSFEAFFFDSPYRILRDLNSFYFYDRDLNSRDDSRYVKDFSDNFNPLSGGGDTISDINDIIKKTINLNPDEAIIKLERCFICFRKLTK